MDVLVLDGKSYVKAGKAAKDLGYATDYVGQLCRSGKIKSHLIGRTWYVDQEELSTHKIEKKRSSRQKAREQVRKVMSERREETTNTYKNIAIRYGSDAEPLLPETRKLAVSAEPVRKEFAYEDRMKGDELEILNKGNPVVMSGDLEVVDVTESDYDQSTTFLTPVVQKSPRRVSVAKQSEAPQETPLAVSEETTTPQIKSFAEKLEDTEVFTQIDSSISTAEQFLTKDTPEPSKDEELMGIVSYLILVTLTSGVIFTFFLSKSVSFTHLGGTTAIENSSLNADFDIVKLKRLLKI